ncbi:hypothetical protein K2173_028282 [Erythroxylum novogranatense]|uniref:Uncharacterized protein n=1 Tax=Erythroxylum novogranatense TaxID=1862640 RepID=A0AAV8U425_9ROSI|nr:hypothetical protein K2173_028282 [Erythroxylum novogranatense]
MDSSQAFPHKKAAYEDNVKNENEDNIGIAGVDDEIHDHFHDTIEQGAEHNGDKMGESKENVNEETERDESKENVHEDSNSERGTGDDNNKGDRIESKETYNEEITGSNNQEMNKNTSEQKKIVGENQETKMLNIACEVFFYVCLSIYCLTVPDSSIFLYVK